MMTIVAPGERCDDCSLVAGLRRGDQDSVETLVDCYGGWIHRVASRLLGDPRDAEEVTQDVLLTVAHKIGTFKGAAKLSSWIYRIAANAAYGKLRARSAPTLPLEEDFYDLHESQRGAPRDWSAHCEDPAVQAELRAVIERAIGELPTEFRTAVVLHDVEGLPNAEVADILGLSLPALKSRVHRARLALQARLSRYFEQRGER